MSASNYDDVCRQLSNAGLLYQAPLQVGTTKPVRCRVDGAGKEKRGWYWLHELNSPRGDLLIVGSYGVNRGNDHGTQKIELGKQTQLSDDQRKALRKQLAEATKRAEREREAEIQRAATHAARAWERLAREGDAAYLQHKGVGGHGLRYTRNGSAVVPLTDHAGKIYGLQFLRTAAQAEQAKRPAKEFWPTGLGKRGHFHLIGQPPTGDEVILVCEGYATGATLHEATGLPVVVAFDAGNLMPVCDALRKQWRRVRFLLCADDDSLGKCRACGERFIHTDHPTECPACGQPHNWTNAGVSAARTVVLEQGRDRAAWCIPTFHDEDRRRQAFLATGRKLTDYNDLATEAAGPLAAAQQVNATLRQLGWLPSPAAAPPSSPIGGAGGAKPRLTVLQNGTELLKRFVYVYGSNGAVFDRQEHQLVKIEDMRNLCVRTDVHKHWMESPERPIARMEEVGFDPACTDTGITCNLWAGWPTEPRAGTCQRLLDHLYYLCSGEDNPAEVHQWILRWLAYPIQHPGAKMRSTVVLHGGQGAGKNIVFEAVMAIYGPYGRILDQDALTTPYNDWASRKLFLIADEVVAQAERYELKNKLKTLVTGTRIRINPKHIASYEEDNHCNLVFLSNEPMPVVLEEDDRRHCVVRTPAKREKAYYDALGSEIENGGIAALHHHLLHLDLGDFTPFTEPPRTRSKSDLIGLAQDSPVDFIDALVAGDVGTLRPTPGLVTEWFAVYQHWCGRMGIKPATQKRFVSSIKHHRKLESIRKNYRVGYTTLGPHATYLFGQRPPEGENEIDWLGRQFTTMGAAARDYRQGVNPLAMADDGGFQ